ncbi:MAG TPA: STAS/SEC14 domain-containing protein [Burkholderiales bacterium]|jgi:stage II sporulation SpoAA-like protein|nr:STAS/SEC14 domain-containing protein [Burkholderiales bacterium]
MNLENAARGEEEPRSPEDEEAQAAVNHGAMWYRISVEPGYIRAELFGRKTVEETRKFLDALLAEGLKHQRGNILIYVRNSKPIFTVERYGFSRYLEIAYRSAHKIALMGDSLELRLAHQYIATLALMRGVNLRTFMDETAAIDWLRSGETPSQVPELP